MQVCHTIDTEPIVDIQIRHVYQSILNNIGTFITDFFTDTVIQLTDDRHQLWYCPL